MTKTDGYIETDQDGRIVGVAVRVGDLPPNFRGRVGLSCDGTSTVSTLLVPAVPTGKPPEPPHEFIGCGGYEQFHCCANTCADGSMCCGSDDDEVHTNWKQSKADQQP